MQYVMDCMRENTTYVRNIKKYLLAALYNAPSTISNYYSSLVQHDKVADDLDRLSGDARVVDAIYAVNDVQRRKRTLKTDN